MNGTTVRAYLRSHVLGLVAIFIALTGTAVAAGGSSGDGPGASASVVTDAKFKKLKKRVAANEQKIAALEAKPAPAIPTTLPPSGPAGGSLTGTYPNPTLAANSVGASQISAGAVGDTELGTIVTRSGDATLNAGTTNSATANCLAGERIISGGGIVLGIIPAETIELTRSIKTGTVATPGNGWQVSAQNDTAVNAVLVAQAYCLQ